MLKYSTNIFVLITQRFKAIFGESLLPHHLTELIGSNINVSIKKISSQHNFNFSGQKLHRFHFTQLD